MSHLEININQLKSGLLIADILETMLAIEELHKRNEKKIKKYKKLIKEELKGKEIHG